MKKIKWGLPLLIALFACGCEKNTPDPVFVKVNNFIFGVMDDIYFWREQMPVNIDRKQETAPMAYFEKLIDRAEDPWSFVTDDADALLNSFQGNERSFGYSLVFGRIWGTSSFFAIVEYTNPSTPAAENGLLRGDIILKVNQAAITEANFTELFNANQITLTMGKYTVEGLVEIGEKALTSRELNINPILLHEVFEINGRKIGYLIYNQFISKYNNDLTTLFSQFKNSGITDLVVDLRYNPGGEVTAAVHLCSMLVPYSHLANKDVLIKKYWNSRYQEYWTAQHRQDMLETKFDDQVSVNLNLSRIIFITTQSTASASELTISGLSPYSTVETIGSTTTGKYTASATFQPYINDDLDLDPEIDNWAVQPIIFKYTNAIDQSVKGGIPPLVQVDELLLSTYPIPQLGNPAEPLLEQALERIVGQFSTKSKSGAAGPVWKATIRQSGRVPEKQLQKLLVPAPFYCPADRSR